MVRRARRVAATTLALALVLVAGAPAFAEGADGADARPIVLVAGEPTACPSPADVAGALRPMLPRHHVISDEAAAGESAPAARAEVFDLGSVYKISVLGSEREFAEHARACGERAHAAAVFIAVIVEPPVVIVTEPPPPKPPPPPPPPLPPLPPLALRRGPLVLLEVAGRFDVAPRSGSANSLFAGGGSLRLSIGTPNLGVSLGAALESPAVIKLQTGSVRMTRFPLDLSLRAGLRRGRFQGVGELGAVFGLMLLEGQDLRSAGRSTLVDVGLRAAVGLGVWIHDRVAPWFSLATEVYPKPQQILVDPLGIIGNTPYVWITATAGFAFRLH